MPIDQVAKSLLLPDGTHHPLRERDVTMLEPHEVRMLSWLHDWAYKNQLSIVCKRCDSAITGQNNDAARSISVTCLCHEWRFTR